MLLVRSLLPVCLRCLMFLAAVIVAFEGPALNLYSCCHHLTTVTCLVDHEVDCVDNF